MDNVFWVPRQDVSWYWKGFHEDKWRATLNALPYCFSPHLWDEYATLGYDPLYPMCVQSGIFIKSLYQAKLENKI